MFLGVGFVVVLLVGEVVLCRVNFTSRFLFFLGRIVVFIEYRVGFFGFRWVGIGELVLGCGW